MKPSTLLMAVTVLLYFGLSSAQNDASKKPQWGWQKETTASLNLTQSTFDNYAQGGENSTAWQFRIGLKFVNDREKYNWANTGKLEYGRNKTGEDEFKKSVDELKFESVFTLKMSKYVNPYAAVTAESQFAAGYDYTQTPKKAISNFLDPGYFREAVGGGYKPNDIILFRLGAALKQTVTRNFNSYSDDPETEAVEKIRNEIGAEGVIDFNYKISENSLVKSKVELFSNMKAFDEIDVIWDTDLTAKITKFIAFNFNVKLLYDKDISPKRQLKQVMGIGLSYSLF